MVSAFSVVNQKVVICVDWKKRCMWKCFENYKALSRFQTLLVIFLWHITPVVFWAWKYFFHFSCFPCVPNKEGNKDTFPSSYVWIPLGSEAGWVVCSWSSSQKVNSKIWTLRSYSHGGEERSQMFHWWSGSCWVSLIKLGPLTLAARTLLTLLLES